MERGKLIEQLDTLRAEHENATLEAQVCHTHGRVTSHMGASCHMSRTSAPCNT